MGISRDRAKAACRAMKRGDLLFFLVSLDDATIAAWNLENEDQDKTIASYIGAAKQQAVVQEVQAAAAQLQATQAAHAAGGWDSKVKKGSSDGAWVSKQKYGITDSMRKDLSLAAPTVSAAGSASTLSRYKPARPLSIRMQPLGTLPHSPAALPLSPAGTARVDKIAMRHAKQQLSAVEAVGCRAMTLEHSYAQAVADPETLQRFVMLVYLLMHGRPLVEYQQSRELLQALNVTVIGSHWSTRSAVGMLAGINQALEDELVHTVNFKIFAIGLYLKSSDSVFQVGDRVLLSTMKDKYLRNEQCGGLILVNEEEIEPLVVDRFAQLEPGATYTTSLPYYKEALSSVLGEARHLQQSREDEFGKALTLYAQRAEPDQGYELREDLRMQLTSDKKIAEHDVVVLGKDKAYVGSHKTHAKGAKPVKEIAQRCKELAKLPNKLPAIVMPAFMVERPEPEAELKIQKACKDLNVVRFHRSGHAIIVMNSMGAVGRLQRF
ncbi:hypothetical protein QJQ45_007370 [Haematococcus lacustris]|nr:hypothetical protein QJQ45_007370 [Haematococcus lacustris]